MFVWGSEGPQAEGPNAYLPSYWMPALSFTHSLSFSGRLKQPTNIENDFFQGHITT